MPQTETLGQIMRLLSLAELLEERPSLSCSKLSATLSVSERTVQRDLQLLEESGLKPTDSADTGLSSTTNDPPPIELSSVEVLSLLLVAEQATSSRAVPPSSPLAEACAKLRDVLPSSLQASVSTGSSVSIRMPPASQPTRVGAFFPTFASALSDRQELEVSYDSVAEAGHIETRLRLYHLTFRTRAWYAVAWSSLHAEVRTFHLGRVLTARRTGEAYEVPADFSPGEYFGNAWSMIPGDREYDVEVRFTGSVSRSVADVRWHRTQRLKWEEDGSLIASFRVSGLHEIASWVLGYGDRAEVLSPPELRMKMRDRVCTLSRIYQPD